MNKQKGSSTIAMIALVAIALMVGIWIGAEKDIVIFEINEIPTSLQEIIRGKNTNICDEDGNRYKTEMTARAAGLSDAKFGATYCPEYKMHKSWDIDKNGVNDCYDNNSCSKNLDYMSPRNK